jgi:hypothetical protein
MGAAQAQHGAGAKDAAILVIPIKVFHGELLYQQGLLICFNG